MAVNVKLPQKVRFRQALKLFFTNAFNFSGRSSVSEYWWAMVELEFIVTLPMLVVRWNTANIRLPAHQGSNALAIIPYWFRATPVWTTIAIAALLITLIPQLSLTVRRFRDAGFAGWWLLLYFGPLVLVTAQLFAYNVVLLLISLTVLAFSLYILTKPGPEAS